MEQLINAFLRRGARRDGLEIKIVGGGRVIAGMGDVGRSNVDFVREFLGAEHMPIQVEDVGLAVARRVRYRAQTGQLRVLHLPVAENRKIAARETQLAAKIRTDVEHPPEIELF
jgi:chemotaxis protein CheD